MIRVFGWNLLTHQSFFSFATKPLQYVCSQEYGSSSLKFSPFEFACKANSAQNRERIFMSDLAAKLHRFYHTLELQDSVICQSFIIFWLLLFVAVTYSIEYSFGGFLYFFLLKNLLQPSTYSKVNCSAKDREEKL